MRLGEDKGLGISKIELAKGQISNARRGEGGPSNVKIEDKDVGKGDTLGASILEFEAVGPLARFLRPFFGDEINEKSRG